MGYIGMYSPKGYGFSAIWVIRRVSILAALAILVINWERFLYPSLDMGMFLSREATYSLLSKRKSSKALRLNLGSSYNPGLKQDFDVRYLS